MKPIIKTCYFTLLLFFSTVAKSQNEDTGIRGVENVIISEEAGHKYIAAYSKNFIKTPADYATLEESFFIDFPFIDKFTSLLNNYNGFSFVFGTDINNSNKQNLFLVPTVKKKVSSTEYKNEFRWVSPSNVSNCTFRNFSEIGSAKAKSRKSRFDFYHRMAGTAGFRDNLSISVWMDGVIMQFIRDTIKNYPQDDTIRLIGINVYNASYETMIDPSGKSTLGQQYPIQSTVVIVFKAQNKNTGEIFDYWKFSEALYNIYHQMGFNIYYQKSKKFFFNYQLGALNHGELCPSRCGD